MAEQQEQKEEEVSAEEMEGFKLAFKRFVKEGEETIATDDLTTIMRSLNMNPTDEEVKEMVDAIDTDHSGKIEFPEFLAVMTKRKNTVDESDSLRTAFKLFDKDGSGFLDKEELKAILQTDADEIDELMKVMDTNGDGKIDFEEFVAMMTQ